MKEIRPIKANMNECFVKSSTYASSDVQAFTKIMR